ncbi:MAG: hypothetical protein FWG89_08615 [Treponema sp.]|nr:hypothetical protein [Treponema sp.]
MKHCLLFLFFFPVVLFAVPLHSPTWGFRLDLPEGYEYADGNNFDRFSFLGPYGAHFDIVVYNGVYRNIEHMMQDVNRRLSNSGDNDLFEYENRAAAIIELTMPNHAGWGLALELAGSAAGNTPLLLALAYAPLSIEHVDLFHLSALDSIAPTMAEMRRPGPIMEFTHPRGEHRQTAIAGTGLNALVRENDAEAAQELVDREFTLLTYYQGDSRWQEAWIRFYRMIYRDSWDRVSDAVFRLERSMNVGAEDRSDSAFAERALTFVQGFSYERDFDGSDFVNLVTAVTEGRGDCDSRAMLWAMILTQANIPAGIMVSRNHSHAMGLADIPGTGARFEADGIRWLVAETTESVDIGLISADMSDVESWLAVLFE